ncbi:Core atranone cluster (CAC) protein 1, partial [Pseudocercospora fuligena]
MDKSLPGTNPGLLYVNSAIKDQRLSEETYTDWYERVHIPDVFQTTGPGAPTKAYRWKALDPAADKPYLALYPTTEVAFLGSDEFKQIPVHCDKLPGSGKIFELADFDTRYYKLKQLYGPKSEVVDDAQPDFVIVAGFTPADEEDYEQWYQQEHLLEISCITGWRKTERYELFFARSNRDYDNPLVAEKPKFLTLLAKASESEWTKKSMGSMKRAEVAAFQKLAYFEKS